MTHPTHETSLLMRAVLEVAGAKRVSIVTGYALGTVYAMGRDPADANPDATGQANPFDRVEQLGELCATRGQEGRAVLVQMREWTDRLYDRLMGAQVEPATTVIRFRAMIDAARETAEALAKCDPESPDYAAVHKEVSEAIASLENVLRAFAMPAPGGPLKVA